MLQETLAYLLPLLLWGAVSGVLNLILTRKSQIEAWTSAHPTLAGWSKFLRGVGLDPWALHAWLTLLVSKKLPAAQQADSPIAKAEQRKADAKKLADDPVSIIPPGTLLIFLGAVCFGSAYGLTGCHDVQPCSTEDLATGPLALHNAKCAADRQAKFPDYPDDKCDVTPGCAALVAECDRWSEERCQ